MANNNLELDEGFEEIPLDEGFEEVPLTQPVGANEESFLEDALETAGAGVAGAAQGFTFGTATKALGALEALAEQEDLSDLKSLYEKYKESSAKRKQQYEELAKKHGVAVGIGEIGGMLLNPLPGATSKALVEAAGAAKLAKALQIEPTLVGRMGAGGLIGGGMEAVQSEGEGKEYLKDIAKGTGLGMAVGAGEEWLARGATWGKGYIERSPKIQRIIRSFKLSRGTPFDMNPEGKPIALTEEATKQGGGPTPIFKQLDFVKEKMTKSLEKMYDFARNEFDGFFKKYGDEIIDPNNPEIKTILNTLEQNKDILKKTLGSEKVEQLLEGIPKLGSLGEPISGNYKGTVSNLYDLRRALYDNIEHLTNPEILNRDTQTLLFGEGNKKGVVHLIDDALSKSEEFGNQYLNLKKNVDIAASPFENLLNRTMDDEARVIRLSDLSDSQARKKAGAIFKSMAESMGGVGFRDVKHRIAFNEMIDKYESVIKHLYENSPEFKSIINKLGKLKVQGQGAPSASELETALAKLQSGEKLESFAGMPTSKLPKEMQDALQAELNALREKAAFEVPSVIEKKAKDVAKDISTFKTSVGERSIEDEAVKDIFSPAGSSSPVKAAAGLGSMVRTAEDYAKSFHPAVKAVVTAPIRVHVNLKNATIDQLKQYAQVLSSHSNPAISNIGRAAINSLDEGPVAKAAFINMAMQQPEIRQLLNLSVDRSKEK